MKKFSKYFWTCMVIAIISLVCGVLIAMRSPTACAVLTVIAFIAWYAGVMAPDHEKYKAQEFEEPDYEWENDVRRGR
jgi:hypothetical protein